MSCDRTRPLLGPYRDGELSESDRSTVDGHLATCALCTSLAADQVRLTSHIANGARKDLPPGLAGQIKAALDAEDRNAPSATNVHILSPRTAPRPGLPAWAQAAAAITLCVLSGTGGWYAGTQADRADHVTRDVLAAHVRSLLQDNPVQVASSDSHTVRPWFAGKIDVAPGVNDHAAEGFPLVGGRLDMVGSTRAGVVVYKRNLHWINIYMWPSGDRPDAEPGAATRNGYNMLSWTKSGITHWAVSDLNLSELRQLQSLF